MTTLSSLNQAIPSVSSPSPATSTSTSSASKAAAQNSATPPSSAVVTLSQATPASPLQIYTSLGIQANAAPTETWESNSTDAVSTLMAGNYVNPSLASRFSGLGSALLNQFSSTGTNFSQSVQTTYGNSAGSLGQIGGGTQADVELTIVTKSGVEVDLTLDSNQEGLSVSVKSNGPLSGAEQGALAKLSGAFQSAINGISTNPPSLNLSGLTQFDPSVLASVNLQSSVTTNGQPVQSIAFADNSSGKTVSVTEPSGTIKLSVNASDSLIEGNQQQRTQAINQYLQQFDDANTRGHGDAALMAVFKDAFTQMNSGGPSQSGSATDYAPSISGAQSAILTGLDDFSASITDTSIASNPMRPSEMDTFSYQVSQQTNVQGNQWNGAISQQQQSHLSASYHAPLSSDSPLKLTLLPKSQNYDYMTINDDAESTTSLAYQKGQITQASLNQSASQSTDDSTYMQGKLVSSTATPSKASSSPDLLALLKPYLTSNPTSQNTDQWQQILSDIHSQIFLQANPASLNESQDSLA
jgi:hypothetical protein